MQAERVPAHAGTSCMTVWDEFQKKYWKDTEELEKQLQDAKVLLHTKFRYGAGFFHCSPENPNRVLTQSIDGYDVITRPYPPMTLLKAYPTHDALEGV